MLDRRLHKLLVGLALLTLYGCPGKWEETYRYDEDNPFDLYALHQLLEARPEGLNTVEDSLGAVLTDTTARANYLFVGHRPYYDEAAVTALLDFVERGNTALIAAYDLPEDLAYHLFGYDCFYLEQDYYYGYDHYPYVYPDTVQDVVFRISEGDTIAIPGFVYEGGYYKSTSHIDATLLCDALLENEIMHLVDTGFVAMVRLPWGEGEFLFNVNPFYLTNYYVVDSLHHRYAEEVVSELGAGPVYWDEFSRTPPPFDNSGQSSPNNRGQYNGGRNLLSGNEALLYIQEQPPLSMAWYTLVVAALLFVLFRGKRRQRIIPELPARENSSKRFIDTISRLIYQKGNHRALALREIGQLRYHLSEKFHLRWKEGELPPDDLGERIGADPAVSARALAEIRSVNTASQLEDGDLLRFYRAVEPLYKL